MSQQSSAITEETTDEAIVALTLKDQEAFSHLVERYQARLQRFIRRISNVHPEEVHDILQEVFIKIYVNLNGFDQKLSFSSWAYRIARNTVISHHRKVTARPQKAYNADGEIEIFKRIASDLDLNRDVDGTLLREHLIEAMTEIDQKYRDVLVLRFFEEKSYDEIGDILKKPPGTVATLLSRAKKKLAAVYTKGI